MSGPATIRALPPPPQANATGKSTPPEPAPALNTILGYIEPIAPGTMAPIANDGFAPIPEDLLPPGTVVGDYEIVELIGAGGMGSVYAARYPMIDRQVAIKVIASHLCRDASLVQQFVIEARAANQISNRHVVDIHTLGTLHDGRPYLVMELLRGQTLTQRIDSGPIELDEVVAILDQIAEAVEAAHRVPIVHRDLKPDNVFLEDSSDGPEVKILDFGIAKLAGEVSPTSDVVPSGLRSTGALLGTPHYMAPEQARAQLVGTPADLYALGLIAFEMLTGRPPFEADSAAEILVAHLQTRPPRLAGLRPEVPPVLDDLVDRLLSKDPSQRPSATEVRAVLRTLYHRSYPRVIPTVDLPLQDRARLWLRRPRSRILFGAPIALGALMLAAFLFLSGGDDPPPSKPAPSAPAAAAGTDSPAAPGASAAPAREPVVAPAREPVVAPASEPVVAPAREPVVAPASAPGGAPASASGAAPVVPPVSPPDVQSPGGAASPPPVAPGTSPAVPMDRDAPIRDPF